MSPGGKKSLCTIPREFQNTVARSIWGHFRCVRCGRFLAWLLPTAARYRCLLRLIVYPSFVNSNQIVEKLLLVATVRLQSLTCCLNLTVVQYLGYTLYFDKFEVKARGNQIANVVFVFTKDVAKPWKKYLRAIIKLLGDGGQQMRVDRIWGRRVRSASPVFLLLFLKKQGHRVIVI